MAPAKQGPKAASSTRIPPSTHTAAQAGQPGPVRAQAPTQIAAAVAATTEVAAMHVMRSFAASLAHLARPELDPPLLLANARKMPGGIRARFKRRGRSPRLPRPPPSPSLMMGSKRNGSQKGSNGLQRPSRPMPQKGSKKGSQPPSPRMP